MSQTKAGLLYYMGRTITHEANRLEVIRRDQHLALNIFLGALHREYKKAMGR